MPITHLVRLIKPDLWDPISEGNDAEPKFEVFKTCLNLPQKLSFWQCDGSDIKDVLKVSAAAIAERETIVGVFPVILEIESLKNAQFKWSDTPANSPIAHLNKLHVEMGELTAPRACTLVDMIRKAIVQGNMKMYTYAEILGEITRHCHGKKNYISQLKKDVRQRVQELLNSNT